MSCGAVPNGEKVSLLEDDLAATKSEFRAFKERVDERLTALEAVNLELAALKERVKTLEGSNEQQAKHLEKRVAAIEERPPETRTNVEEVAAPILKEASAPEPEKLTLDVLIRDAEEENAGYELKGKAWDAVLFVGAGVMGKVGASFMVLTLLLNIFGQILFLRILAFSRSFLGGSPPSEKSLALWRINSGHTFQSEQAGASLVSRVCGFDDSLSTASAQKNLASDADEYLNEAIAGTNLGPLLCMFCLALWVLTVIAHIKEMTSFTISLFLLRSKETSLRRDSDGSLTVVSISNLRFGALLGLSALRVGITVTLLWLGCLWLARTGSVDDLLLNAVALTFVLDLDELLYSALAPDTAQLLVNKSKPLPGFRPRHWHGIGVRPVGYFLACFVLIAVLRAGEIEETKDTMSGINTTLCGGLQNVIIDVEPLSKRITMVDTFKWNGTATEIYTPVEELVNDLIWDRRSWGRNENIEKAKSYASIPIGEFAGLSLCTDQDYEIEPHSDLFVALTNNRTVYKSCAELVQYCGMPYFDQLRLFCPVTCGCDSPYIGVDRHGCPPTCYNTPQYRSELLSMPCNDTQPQDFPSAPQFQRMQRWAGAFGVSILDCRAAPQLLCLPPSITLVPSFRAYCPVACGCKGGGTECPPSCSVMT